MPPDHSTAPSSPTLVRLAARAAWAARHAHEPAWRERAALHLLDWLGCAARGVQSPQGHAFTRWVSSQGAGPVATLAGVHVDAACAACFHGALGSALEMDDVHRSSILHPGPVVIPAALAAVCSAGASGSGTPLLAALLAGYEVAVRVGRALGPTHYQLWHSTSTAGHFAAAAAAATALGLDEHGTAQAMALAGSKAGGLWQVRHESQMGKAWHMAGAARDGVTTAQLAACGLTGPLGVLDGPSGWFAATAPAAQLALLDEDRATPWMDDVSFKPWPACRHAHPALDALRTALAGQALRPDEVLSVQVGSYADALRFCDRAAPADEGQAKFSIQHALAAWLVWGEPQLAHYQPAAITDARVAALRQRVQLQVDAGIDALFPSHYGARVRLQTHDGRHFEARLQDTCGDPARPLSAAALRSKAGLLMADAGWPAARIEAAFVACAALARLPQTESPCPGSATPLQQLIQVIIGHEPG